MFPMHNMTYAERCMYLQHENEGTNKQNEQTYKRTNVQADKRTNEQNKQTNKRTNEQMNERTNERTNE